MKISDVINRLEKKREAHGDIEMVDVFWTQEDIYHLAEDKGVELTQEEMESIAYKLENNHDANYGICWDTIDFAIQDIIKER